MGLVRQINIPGLRIQRMFSWAIHPQALAEVGEASALHLFRAVQTETVRLLGSASGEP
jgi:hypothetical protein